MSLSYIEPELIADGAGQEARPGTPIKHLQQLVDAVKHGTAEITASPDFASVLLRVASALAIAFALVRLAKIYIA